MGSESYSIVLVFKEKGRGNRRGLLHIDKINYSQYQNL